MIIYTFHSAAISKNLNLSRDNFFNVFLSYRESNVLVLQHKNLLFKKREKKNFDPNRIKERGFEVRGPSIIMTSLNVLLATMAFYTLYFWVREMWKEK